MEIKFVRKDISSNNNNNKIQASGPQRAEKEKELWKNYNNKKKVATATIVLCKIPRMTCWSSYSTRTHHPSAVLWKKKRRNNTISTNINGIVSITAIQRHLSIVTSRQCVRFFWFCFVSFCGPIDVSVRVI